MRILLVTDLYPIGDENISKALFDFVQNWQKLGHRVEVIRPNFILNAKIRGRKIIKEKIYYENGIKIYNLNFITPFLFNIRRKLPKDFSLYFYDVMISHMPSGALTALRLLEKENIKYISGVHASDITVLKDFKYAVYFRNRLKLSYLRADKTAARSPVLQKKIEQIIPEIQDKTFTAYSGIDGDNKIGGITNFDYENMRICTASSLIKRKKIDVIINALAKTERNFHFTIAGEGSEEKNLKKLARQTGTSEKISFAGKLKKNEVFDMMKNNDIFILISINETFGLVYLEAMRAGCIVIARRDEGIDGILENEKNGFLIDGSADELFNCLKKIYNMKETEINKIRLNAQETVKNLTEEKAALNYINNIR